MSEESIINEIEANREEYIKFLQKLVQINTYNPPGNEKDLAVVIEQYLKEVNIESEIFPFGNNRANLIATLNDNFDDINLLYNGHMDTVPPSSLENWKYSPLSAYIKRNKIMYGRGTTDMKSGLAAMIIALSILKKLKIKLSGNLILNAVADEEVGGELGTKWCLDNKLKSIKCNFAIVGESTGLNPLPKAIIVGEKGILQIKIITKGIACHSSVSFMGKNAIYMMSEIIQNLDKLEIPEVAPPMSEIKILNLLNSAFPNEEIFNRIYNEQPELQGIVKSLLKSTKSMNVIKGGVKENIVPDQCESIIDFRLLPGQKPEVIINALKKLITEMGYTLKDTPKGDPNEIFVYLEIFTIAAPSYWKNWEDSQELKEFFKLVEKIYGKKPFYFLFPGTTDAQYYRNSKYCEKTINFGPGNARTMHAINENIDLQDFINVIKVYTLWAYHFLI
jgi:succinyl-diaminopimelate desuccinylase